jgi:hypothetical protein
MKSDRSIKYVRKARLGQASEDKVPKAHAEARDLQVESRIIAHPQIGLTDGLLKSDLPVFRQARTNGLNELPFVLSLSKDLIKPSLN